MDHALRQRMSETMMRSLASMCEGSIAVDKDARIVWINERYADRLGVESETALGQPIESVIPESLLRRVVETGQPILLDIMRFGDKHFVVNRLPLHDDDGQVIGAVGFVFFDRLDSLKPIIAKFDHLNEQLQEARRQLDSLRSTRYRLEDVVGEHPAILEVKRQLRRVARTDSPVLILGETGTGKELLAQSVHAHSERRSKPFIAVNLSAIPETLIEAELFGYAPGTFTGGDRKGRKGKFALADGGTLFLDEVGELPLPIQAKLLRVLEEMVIEPLGSHTVTRVDVRVVAATSQDLDARMAAGDYRADLFYRLNVLPIHVPPLRERLEDLPLLTRHFLERIAIDLGEHTRSVSEAGLAALAAHDWPGNVRELRNTLERLCLVVDDAEFSAEQIRSVLTVRSSAPVTPNGMAHLSDIVADAQQRALAEAMRRTGGQKQAAAKLLGISRSRLYELLGSGSAHS